MQPVSPPKNDSSIDTGGDIATGRPSNCDSPASSIGTNSKSNPSYQSGKISTFFQSCLTAVSICICLQVILTLCAGMHPVIELAAHGSMHATILACLVLPLLILFRRKRLLVCLSIATLLLLSITRPWYLAWPAPIAASKGVSQLKVLSWNVLSVNQSFAEIEAIVAEVDPDVIVFIEVRPDLLDGLSRITSDYPFFIDRPRWGGEGIAVLSRIRGTEFIFEDYDLPRQPAIVASIPPARGGTKIQIDGPTLNLVALHTLSPLPTHRSAIRNRQISALLEWSKPIEAPMCVCGDFNITPWAPSFRKLIRGGFVDSRIGSGNCASWPSNLGMLGIPIDHALSKGDCFVFDRKVLNRSSGSDHRPIVFSVAY